MAGYEIAYTGALGDDLKGALIVYLASGSNPITEEAWATYVPPEGYGLNTPRAIWFSELDVLGSPYVPTGEITYITTSDGYTWESVAALQRSVYPYKEITVNGHTLSPQEIAYSISTPPPGIVLVDSNDKNHQNLFYGTQGAYADQAHIQYFIEDLWGNTYILKSINASNNTPELVEQAVADAVLPIGWRKLAPAYFEEDTYYTPSYSGENDSIAHANEFRDSADSAWMQITWAENGMTLNAAAEGGLPIWAGQTGGNLLGSYNNDVMYGAQGDDLITGGHGDDHLDGGRGLNHALYVGNLSQFQISQADDGQLTVVDTINDRNGTDTLDRIQRLRFTDTSVAFDTDIGQNAGEIYRLYEAALGRVGDEEGLGFWLAALDNGTSLTAIANQFISSQEFLTLHGSQETSNQSFVATLYSNVLARTPDSEGANFWEQALNQGFSRAQILVAFSESAEFVANTQELVAAGVQYQEWLG